MFENIALAFQGIWNHKLRSTLTMLGIIIGIASIITIVSTIKGTNKQIKQNLIGSGTNAVVVDLYQDDQPLELEYMGNPEGVSLITDETRQELETLDGVEAASLFRHRSWTQNVYYQDKPFNGNLYGIDTNYFGVYGYKLCYGRNFIKSDFSNSRKVVILDSMAAKGLFGGENPVGEVIEISTQPFTVIGVVAENDKFTPVIENINDYYMYADTSSGSVFVPDTVWPIIYRYDEPQSVAVRAFDTDSMTSAGRAVADYLTDSQIIDKASPYSYRSQDMLEQAQQLQAMSNSTNNQLIWIAGISLLVGGIGVMNIMLVSVTERTSEIGLKKAIGAKKRRILAQFLTEAAVLTSLGGVLGVAVGIVMAIMLSSAIGMPTAISVSAALIAVIFSMLIGVIFGLLPATKAARMNPIDALRRE